jgi:hypothetical protein
VYIDFNKTAVLPTNDVRDGTASINTLSDRGNAPWIRVPQDATQISFICNVACNITIGAWVTE